MTSHWIYKGNNITEVPEGMKGFVYLITHQLSGKMYIGKKNFYSTRTLKPLKGKKRKRKVTKESDWRFYSSSSKYVNELIVEHGVEDFTFEILMSCPDKAQTNYAELVYQIKWNVLDAIDSEGERVFLNENIALRYYHSDKYKDFREVLNEVTDHPTHDSNPDPHLRML